MAKINIPSKSLQPPDQLPAGIHQVMLVGFKPAMSKGKDGKTPTLNLNPQIKIINSQLTDKDGRTINGKQVFESMNIQAGWVIRDFIHCFGVDFVPAPTPDDPDGKAIPGTEVWDNAGDNPATWPSYNGPLLNAQGQLELVEVPGNNGKTRTVTKRYFCQIPGCTEQHSENLAK